MAKIGKRWTAKKYADLREKQKMANEYLYGSKHWLKQGHQARTNALSMKKQFYKSRGLETRGRLSFKNLSRADLKAYEQLLDSIINNTYLNPQKYQAHLEKIKSNTDKQILSIFADSGDESGAQAYDDFLQSDIFKMLIDVGINPSSLVNYITSWESGGFSLSDFVEKSKEFVELFNEDEYTTDDYFAFMDEYRADMTGV